MSHCHDASYGSSCGCCGSCQCKSSYSGSSSSAHSSGCGSSKTDGCAFSEKFLELADQAWMEVLKEKIKDHIRHHAHLDELATIISEANSERWKRKLEDKAGSMHYQDKIKKFFHPCCHSQCEKKH